MIQYNSATDEFTGGSARVVIGPEGMTTEVGTGNCQTFEAHRGFESRGDLLSTATNRTGGPVVGRAVQPSDLVRVQGMEIPVHVALDLGLIAKDSAGNFVNTAEGTTTEAAWQAQQPKDRTGETQLANGETAEEASESTFRADDNTEAIRAAVDKEFDLADQVSVVESMLNNDGEIDRVVLTRLASKAGIEPEALAGAVDSLYTGLERAVYGKVEGLGVYDKDAFESFLHSSPMMQQRLAESVRGLVQHNSTSGFEALAKDFTRVADRVDPASVADALEDAGIPFTHVRGGGIMLDLNAQGLGEISYQTAVEMGIIKLSKNR